MVHNKTCQSKRHGAHGRLDGREFLELVKMYVFRRKIDTNSGEQRGFQRLYVLGTSGVCHGHGAGAWQLALDSYRVAEYT